MSLYHVDQYDRAHGTVAIRLDAGAANSLLLSLERLDQQDGLDPALATLRESLKAALMTKSSGDTDSAPSSAAG